MHYCIFPYVEISQLLKVKIVMRNCPILRVKILVCVILFLFRRTIGIKKKTPLIYEVSCFLKQESPIVLMNSFLFPEGNTNKRSLEEFVNEFQTQFILFKS